MGLASTVRLLVTDATGTTKVAIVVTSRLLTRLRATRIVATAIPKTRENATEVHVLVTLHLLALIDGVPVGRIPLEGVVETNLSPLMTTAMVMSPRPRVPTTQNAGAYLTLSTTRVATRTLATVASLEILPSDVHLTVAIASMEVLVVVSRT